MKTKKLLASVLLITLLFPSASVFAGTGNPGDGNMVANERYAEDQWGGYVDMDPAGGGVTVSDTLVTGKFWSQNFGWVEMQPIAGQGVTLTQSGGQGNLDGFAWSRQAGWIYFGPDPSTSPAGGVTIDINGYFHGTAWSENFGFIAFGTSMQGLTTFTESGDQGITWARTEWRPDTTASADPVLNDLSDFINSTTVTPSWTPSTDGTEYYLEYADDNTFTNILGNSGWISNLNFDATGLTDGQEYCFRVKSRDVSLNESAWSNQDCTTIDTTAPTTGTATLPEGNYSADLTMPIEWTGFSDANSGINYYQIQVATDAGFSTVVLDTTQPNTISNYDYNGDENVTYYARVRAVDIAGNESAWVNTTPTDSELHQTSGTVASTVGAGLSAASVIFTSDTNGSTYSVITAADGTYRIDLPQGDTYSVTASHTAYQPKNLNLTVPANPVPVFDIVLDPLGTNPDTADFSGNITDSATGLPIAGAQVEIVNQSNGLTYIVTTDNNGDYVLQLPVGTDTYDVKISADNYVSQDNTITVSDNTPIVQNVALVANPPVNATTYGLVTDNSGTLLENVDVLFTDIISDTTYQSTTDTDGRYAIDIPASDYTIGYTLAGYNPAGRSETLSAGYNALTDQVLDTTTNPLVQGSVKDASNNPIPDVVITFTDPDTGIVYGAAVTDPSGNYSFNLPPDDNYVISFKKEGYEPEQQTPYVVTDPGPNTVPDQIMNPNPSDLLLIDGFVKKQSDSAPIENASVVITDSLGKIVSLTTDATGLHEVYLKAGVYDIDFSAEGFEPSTQTSVSLNVGNTTISDELLTAESYAGAMDTGRVLDQSSQPVANATITVTDPLTGDVYTTVTDSLGYYTAPTLPDGQVYDAEIAVPGGSTFLAPGLTVNSNIIDDAVIDTSASNTMDPVTTGLVTTSDETPIADAEITLTDISGNTIEVKTDADGHYTAALTPGENYVATVRHPVDGHAIVSGVSDTNPDIIVDLTPYGTNNILPSAPIGIVGLVTEPDGVTPLDGSVITITDSSGNSYTTTANSDGVYSYPLPNGPYTVHVADPDLGTITVATTATEGRIPKISGPYTPLATQVVSAPLTQGRVVKSSTGNPVVGASVTMVNTTNNLQYNTTTDNNGNFLLDLPPGNYNAVVSHPSFLGPVNLNINVTSLVIPTITIALDQKPSTSAPAPTAKKQKGGGRVPIFRIASNPDRDVTEITKHNFEKAYAESVTQAEEWNRGVRGKVVSYLDPSGKERFVGYRTGRRAISAEEQKRPERIVWRDYRKDIVTAVFDDKDFLSSAEISGLSEQVLPKYTVMGFEDTEESEENYEVISRINSWGVLKTDTRNFKGKEDLSWEDFYRSLIWSRHLPVDYEQLEGVDEKYLEESRALLIYKTALSNGLWDSKVSTEKPITRAYTLAKLMEVLVGEKSEGNLRDFGFEDVDTNGKHAPYIRRAIVRGFIEPTEKFRPNDPVTRLEFAQWFTAIYTQIEKPFFDNESELSVNEKIEYFYKKALVRDPDFLKDKLEKFQRVVNYKGYSDESFKTSAPRKSGARPSIRSLYRGESALETKQRTEEAIKKARSGKEFLRGDSEETVEKDNANTTKEGDLILENPDVVQ